MKSFKLFTLAAALFVMASCGGSSVGIADADLIGKWQPEKMTVEVPKAVQDQLSIPDLEKQMLSENQKTGWLEFKADSTFVIQESENGNSTEGTWAVKDNVVELKVSASGKELTLPFTVESISADKLELDYASMAMTMMGVNKMPFGSMKLKFIMTYKKL